MSIHDFDAIIVAYGHRYAPDQFEAYVPEDLGPCHLVAGGGVAAREAERATRIGVAQLSGLRDPFAACRIVFSQPAVRGVAA
jgi:hypothetical protein